MSEDTEVSMAELTDDARVITGVGEVTGRDAIEMD
jgi:hypothetical protein